ncbi:Serine-arginine protein 55 [Entomophthora muscae]|uniref:Serine-arginine protein 55 n=2 Tax=Entomophthora muscae TaxID=34485 RepID=A0ACC2UUQ9_9FUNG|nr:Serine-arginine protein 55 [Entomophthora muscae]KAJ9090573.1 Serine-arginine protein 55 [Entomophthora muscae]
MGTRLFIGHLARGTSQDELENFLRGYGEIREIAIIERYGFVEFRNPKDAADALQDLHGRNFRGERIIIEYARSRNAPRERRETRRPGPTRSGHRLIVENVSSRANWQDLKDHMRRAGEVCFADVHKERFGEGVVEFERYDDLKYALEKLQDSDFHGKRIHLVEDSRGGQGSRPSRRGRSRSRSPRRARSYSRSPRRGRGHSPRRSPPRRSRRSPSPRRSPPRRMPSRSRSPRQSTRPRRSATRSRSPQNPESRGSSRSRHGQTPHDSPMRNSAPGVEFDDNPDREEAGEVRSAESPRSEGRVSPYVDPEPIVEMDRSHDHVASDEI